MPQASTREFCEKLHELVNEYIARISMAELIGALECKKLEYYLHCCPQTSRDDDDGESWKAN